MNRLTLCLATLSVLAVPLSAQQEVPMRGNTPIAPQGIKVQPLPESVRYETAAGQTIRVVVHTRGFTNGWSMAPVSEDTILVAERSGQIRAVRKGVLDPLPVTGGPTVRVQGLSGLDMALHPDFDRNRYIYFSYTKPV